MSGRALVIFCSMSKAFFRLLTYNVCRSSMLAEKIFITLASLASYWDWRLNGIRDAGMRRQLQAEMHRRHAGLLRLSKGIVGRAARPRKIVTVIARYKRRERVIVVRPMGKVGGISPCGNPCGRGKITCVSCRDSAGLP